MTQFIPQVYKIDTDRYILVMSGEQLVAIHDELPEHPSKADSVLGCLLEWVEEATFTSQPQEDDGAVIDAKIRGAE